MRSQESMTDSHLAAVPGLIAEFPGWLSYFADRGPFTSPTQLGLYRHAIKLAFLQ